MKIHSFVMFLMKVFDGYLDVQMTVWRRASSENTYKTHMSLYIHVYEYMWVCREFAVVQSLTRFKVWKVTQCCFNARAQSVKPGRSISAFSAFFEYTWFLHARWNGQSYSVQCKKLHSKSLLWKISNLRGESLSESFLLSSSSRYVQVS